MRTPFVIVASSLAATASGTPVALDAEQSHHLGTVLRRGDGDAVTLCDGAGWVAPAVLEGGVAVATADATHRDPPRPALVVHHAVPKGRALDEVVRTLVEIGASAIHPVITDRTESRPSGEKARKVGDRLRSVALSACQQAQSAHLCDVRDPAPLLVTQSDQPSASVRLLAHPAAADAIGPVVRAAGPIEAVELLIGPEGGFSDAEVERARDAGWCVVRAGEGVLRTVHAAPVLAGAVLALIGRYDA